ncbi:MAG: hypothetical protein LBU42_03230 [Prevotellaceae bacterium]|jgi:hypothetical protein|nr:hypothetical protein [Prevotellaceae bacterium]
MFGTVFDTSEQPIDPTPLTPEEQLEKWKTEDWFSPFETCVTWVLAILIFGALAWAMIVY